jgi:FMN phosphatase YigB (HAD superfamily)
MVKAVIFDCFGVLTTDHWKEFLATLPKAQVEPARTIIYKYDSSQLDESEFLAEVRALTGRLPIAVERLLDNEVSKNEELLVYIRKIKPFYKIGLLSNIGSNWIRKSFLSSVEQNLFDEMIFSYEVNMAKPDSGIFELAAARLGESPKNCVMVDDSDGHSAAASKTGMTAIVYQDFEQLKRELDPLLTH